MNSRLNIGLSLYRYLANAYPHEFRIVYGEDLDRLGEDAVPEAWRRYGVWGLVRLLADIAVRLPAEYLSEIRQDVAYSLRVLARSPGFAAVGILSIHSGQKLGIILDQQNTVEIELLVRREELGGTHLAGADDPDIGELIWSDVYRLASIAYSVSPLAFRPVGGYV